LIFAHDILLDYVYLKFSGVCYRALHVFPCKTHFYQHLMILWCYYWSLLC